MKCNLNALQLEFCTYAVSAGYFCGSNEILLGHLSILSILTFLFLLASGCQFKVYFLPNSRNLTQHIGQETRMICLSEENLDSILRVSPPDHTDVNDCILASFAN